MRTPRRHLGLGAVALAAALLAGCEGGPSTQQCSDLLDHVIEIEVSAAGGDAVAEEREKDIEEQKTKLREYLGTEFVDTCKEKYSRERIECALEADSHEALAGCDES